MGLQVVGLMPAELAGMQKNVSPYKLTKDDIIYLHGILNGMPHIKKLYIDINGKWHIKVHQYKGDFPEFKDKEGKFYSRLESSNQYVQKYIDDVDRREKYRKIPVPVPELEIVSEYTKDEINSEFVKLIKK